ncbi:MAG: DNA repair protein RecO [Candidatus Izemoplasmatales bacterium]
MEEYRGIILKKISYKENSEIIYLYTEVGLVGVLVHGSKTIKSPYLNLTKVLNHVKVIAGGKNLKVLRDGEIINNYSQIHESLEKYTYLTHMVELVYFFATHEHDHEKLYNFLLKIIEEVKNNLEYIPYINMVELKMLYLLGVNPNLNSCIVCQETNNLVFSVKEGGVLCTNHLPEKYYSNQVLRVIQKLYYHDINKQPQVSVSKEFLIDIRNAIDEYYEYHLNYHSKTRKMLKGLIGY